MYEQIIEDLRRAYDQKVDERDQKEIAPWKINERELFLTMLQEEDRARLLDIGAGTGRHSQFFQNNGLEVTCTDLSPEMVKRCREKGLTAYTMDYLNLDFPAASFDAIFALNCLLHVPWPTFKEVLKELKTLLQPGGLFYLGQYGGIERAGPWPKDPYEPKRFFSLLSDAQIEAAVTEFFELLYFKQIPLKGNEDFHFQSMILRRRLVE